MPTPTLLDQLLRSPGPSGHEAGPAAVWREGVSAFSDDVRVDRLGSSAVRVPGTAGGWSLAVIGHIDEIGIHVTHVDEKGFVRFGEVGGWDPVQLVGQRIRLATRSGDVIGVIGRKPIHLIDRSENTAPKLKELHLDIGAADVAAPHQPGVELGPVTHHKLGSGPVICRGTILHPVISELLIDTAEQLGMTYTLESEGRNTGTDADAVHASRAGVATGLVSVPLRYMHSSVELADVADIEAAARLIAAFAHTLTAELSLAR